MTRRHSTKTVWIVTALMVNAVFVSVAKAQASDAAALVARADSLEFSQPDSALALVRRALPALTGASNEALRVHALRIGCWASTEGSPDSLSAYAEAGVEAAGKTGNEELLAYLTTCRGYARQSAGDELGALEDFDGGVTTGRRFGVRDLLANALVLRGEIRYTRGDFTGAVQDLNEAYQLFQALGNPARVNYALNAMANLYADARMGQYGRALEYYRQLLVAHEAAQDERRISIVYFNLGSTLERMNRLDEALTNYRRGLAMDQRRGDADEVATDRRAIGVALYKLGRPADALRELEQSVTHFQRRGLTGDEAAARLSRGIALRMLERTSEAIADLEFAHTHYRKAENRRYLEKIHEERAIAYADAGRMREAYDARVEQLANQKALEEDAREEQSARLRVQFESEKKEQDNRALARENALRGTALAAAGRVRRWQLAVIALAGIIIVALGVFAARQILSARRLRTLAMVDELTQVANRRAIMQLAEDRVSDARSGGPGFAVLALDIDHFKQINDSFGHDAGDRVLRRVADACRLALRPGDHVGRTGGEEFVVILPGAPEEAAREVAERLRAAVAASDLHDVSPGLMVTVSIGAAVWGKADRSVSELLGRADASLYEVKRSGRNSVMLAAAE